MEKIDKRISYSLVVDTETANGFDDPLIYDMGLAVVDKRGKVYETYSMVNKDVFYGMKDLMKSAYYAKKLPQYHKEIAEGTRKVVSYYEMRAKVYELCKKYNIKNIMAHNMRFDYNAIQTTQRYLTKSKYRFFFPYGIELWDTMKMAQDTICKQKSYKEWCRKNGYITKNGRVRSKAEILYRYISGDYDFKEEHTGLEDVLIEAEIFAHCMRQHKPMRKKCFA